MKTVSYTPIGRARLYNEAFPSRAPLASNKDWVTGTWCIGAAYKNPNPLYGAYPRGYLERVHTIFPDAQRVLHAFSGGLTVFDAREAAWPDLPRDENGIRQLGDREVELVDLHGPDQGRYPTWIGDLFDFCELWEQLGRFDLILADPPYSENDAKKYETPMVNRAKVMRALRKVCPPGGNLVWLDQVWPMHRKDEWKCWGQIGLVRSTNHRVRLVSIFQAV